MRDVLSWSWLDANTVEGTERKLVRLRGLARRWRIGAESRHRRARRRRDALGSREDGR